jgi:predicted phosphate transport protein (TIGR00153 family)
MFQRQKKIFEQLYEYADMVKGSLDIFNKALAYNLKNGIDKEFEQFSIEIDKKRQDCDNIRRQVERDLFSHSLLPETREDIVELIEIMDQIPNHCESLVNMMEDQKTEIIPAIKEDFAEFMKVSLEAFDLTVKAIQNCFGSMEEVPQLVRKIDGYENIGKKVQRKMIRTIFSEDELQTHPGAQLSQKEIVTETSNILSLCKIISERLIITAIKRKI